MIGALAYFGILNPSSLLPERCNFGTEIGCNDYKLDATNSKLKLKIVNNVGDAISITKITYNIKLTKLTIAINIL